MSTVVSQSVGERMRKIKHKNNPTVVTEKIVNRATVSAGQYYVSGWVDTMRDGELLSSLALTVNMQNGNGMIISLELSHDGESFFSGLSPVIYDGTSKTFSMTTPLTIPTRYFKVLVNNKDTTAKFVDVYATLRG